MIDDLIGRGVTEPYRMFTSRAEYRLLLRADNADQRLTRLGAAAGAVGSRRMAIFNAKEAALDEARQLLKSLTATPEEGRRHGLKLNQDGQRRSAFDMLAYPEVPRERLCAMWPELSPISEATMDQLHAEALYSGYVGRQMADIEAYRKEQNLLLPDDVDYHGIPSLSAELRQKLSRCKPATLGQAARIEGMTPAAISALLRYVKKPMKHTMRATG
jgi:tRNA uridine 5-carboxymethylaminomethyl modification enzyme